jgi:hypothetical protein
VRVVRGVHDARIGCPGGRIQPLACGTLLSKVVSEALQRDETPRLVERYLQAVELRIDLDLQLGRSAELCAELLALTSAYPLRERFWVQGCIVDHEQSTRTLTRMNFSIHSEYATRIGARFKERWVSRPWRRMVIKPAALSISRCLLIACREMSKFSDSSPTRWPSFTRR